MNIDLKSLPEKIRAAAIRLKKYSLFICTLIVLSIYLLLMWQIRYYSSLEPTSIDVANKVNELDTPKIDQEAVNKILLLEDQNIEVKTLFNEARQNPFQE